MRARKKNETFFQSYSWQLVVLKNRKCFEMHARERSVQLMVIFQIQLQSRVFTFESYFISRQKMTKKLEVKSQSCNGSLLW